MHGVSPVRPGWSGICQGAIVIVVVAANTMCNRGSHPTDRAISNQKVRQLGGSKDD